MKITYVYHSCYVVELDKIVLIFDYFKGELPEWGEGKKVFFFASHKHQDHFTLEIFQFADKYNDVAFVLSKDIKLTDKYLIRHNINPQIKDKIIYVGKRTKTQIEMEDGDITVETLRSTDEGVAFIITYNNKTFYHAGDLNWWAWTELSEKENEDMATRYKEEINQLAHRAIDVAFVVLDPRQEEFYWWGLDYFLKNTSAEVVFPMHCWEKYWIINQFKKERNAEGYCDRVINIEHEGIHYMLN